MAIDRAVKNAVIEAARTNDIEPAALLAVVEIESAGQVLEQDGRTPRLLFERHVFHRELKKREPKKLNAAVKAGLAIPKWSKSTQYKDQGTSKGRLALIAKAREVDEECANRSASWGLGQTMGFNAEALKFKSATQLVDYMETGGIPAQVDCMVREIKRNKLDKKLEALDWAGFARGYNGPGYAQNRYDTKLAAAYDRWQEKPLDAVSSSNKGAALARTAGIGVAGGTAVTQVISAAVGPVTENVELVQEVVTAGGQVVDVTRQVVSVAPTGFWENALAFVQSPKFLAAALVVVCIAWGATYYLRARKEVPE